MPGDGGGVSVPLSLFSGLVTELSVPDIPEGLSPENQDVAFLPGSISSRPGMHKVYATPISGNVTITYQKTYVQPNGQALNLILDSAGNLWQEDVVNAPGTLSLVGNVPAGSYAESCTAFGREYLAISDLMHGSGIPLQYDGTNLDRVTQDGPGQSPTLTNFQPPTASIAPVGSPVTVAIVAGPNGIKGGEVELIGKVLYYTTIFIITTSPHGLSVGQNVTISGSTSTPSFNRTWTVAAVDSSTQFEINYTVRASAFTAGGGGTVGTTASSGNSLSRTNNVVTAVTTAAHNFEVGWSVQISGVANTDIGGGIATISRDGNGIVTVTTTTAHGLPAGATIAIAGVTSPDATYNGTFPVAEVTGPLTFTYVQAGTVTAGSATGNVQDVWNTTAFIQSIPSSTTFTYEQLGADDTTTGTGIATILGQVSPGTHECVLMFLTRQGYLTAPSAPVQIVANGGQQISVGSIALGPPNVTARVLAFTGAGGANFFTLLTTPMVNGQVVGSALIIPDNTSTSAIVDFADNTLFGGTAIDIPGRNQFAQVVLAPCSGFFSYASRLFTWGELNKVQNLVNMGFDGGYFPQSFQQRAGSGANSGTGTAWTSPNNVTSTTLYADASLLSLGTSKQLVCEAFGFTVPAGLSNATFNSLALSLECYETGAGAGEGQLVLQLLKAGAPFGSPLTVIVGTTATSGSPHLITLQFPTTGLTPADLNSATFGVEITAKEIEVPHTIDIFVRNVQFQALIFGGAPLGWSQLGSTGGTGILVQQTIPGFAYQMTGVGNSFDAIISQTAYQDAYGIPILTPNTTYIARVKVVADSGLTGNLVAQIVSDSTGMVLSARFPAASLPTSQQFIQMTFDGPTQAEIGSDATLSWFLEGVTGNVTIDEVEIAPELKPYRDNLMRGSYVNGPEQFDGVTGDIGPSSDPTPIRNLFEIRGSMYLNTANGKHETQDNATGEPSTWAVREISESVGALSLKASDPGYTGTGDSGEQWQMTASRGGLYIFAGGEDMKISQEIQSLWESINFNVQQTIWVKNDVVKRRCYIGVPLDTATAPNAILVLDYRELNDASAIGNTAPFRQSYTGKMIASEICRKWTIWNIASNSGEIVQEPAGVQTFTVGSGNGQPPGTANGFGNIYYFDSEKLTDDDYGQIVPFYTTYLFVSHDQAQALGLGLHRLMASYLSMFVTGVGQTTITPLSDTLANAFPPLASYPLSTAQNHDMEWDIWVTGERIGFRIGSIPLDGQTDNSFNLQKLILTLKTDPWAPIRGAI